MNPLWLKNAVYRVINLPKVAESDGRFSCLMSANYIVSDFVYEKELQQALEAHRKGKKAVIPIRLKSCLCDKLPVFELQSLPAKDWIGQIDNQVAWTEVARGIEEVIERIQEKKKRGRKKKGIDSRNI